MSDPLFRFGVIADAQYADTPPHINRYFRATVGKLETAITTINQSEVAFTVNLGDTIDHNVKNFEVIMPLLAKLKAPLYKLLGNHDYYKIWPHEEGAATCYREPAVMEQLGLTEAYYDFEHAGWRFIALNGNDLSLRATDADDPRYLKALESLKEARQHHDLDAETFNSALGAQQLAWLERTLADATAKHQRVVILNHYPIFPDNNHNMWDSQDLLQRLAQHPKVVAYLCGHNHLGNYAQRDGIHYLNFKGMVETQENAYAVVSVYSDHLQVQGYGREPSRELSFSI